MNIDLLVSSLIDQLRVPPLTSAMTAITLTSSLLSGVIIMGFLLYLKKKDHAKLLGIGLAAEMLIVFVLKYSVARPRPEGGLFAVEWVVDTAEYSFPSGHAALAFMAAVILGDCFGRKKELLIYASLVSFSRVYLGVHYFTDILAGSLLGVAIGVIIIRKRGRVLGFINEHV